MKTSTTKYGVAGQIAITAYPKDRQATTFFGSVYGSPGPVTMTWDLGHETRVVEPERFGEKFNVAWVQRFFAEVSV